MIKRLLGRSWSSAQDSGWVPEARRGLTETNRDLGVITFNLLWRPEDWIHRRVESVSLQEAVVHERHVSLDFTIDREARAVVEDGEGTPIHFLPLGLFEKKPLIKFSVEDESGKALPVLTRRRNAALAASVLVAVAESHVSDEFRRAHGDRLPEDLEADVWEIAGGDPIEREEIVARVRSDYQALPQGPSREWRTELATDEDFLDAVEQLSRTFILAVPLKSPKGVRRILKLTYETHGVQPRLRLPFVVRPLVRLGGWLFAGPRERAERESESFRSWWRWLSRALGWRPMAIRIRAPNMQHGGSYHLEVEAPEGLQITLARLTTPDYQDEERRSRQRVHLYCPATVHEGNAEIGLRPRPFTIVRTALMVAILSAALLYIVASHADQLVRQPALAVSVLLIAPAGLAAYIARPREPAVATDALFGLRLLAASSGLWPFIGAVLLVTNGCERTAKPAAGPTARESAPTCIPGAPPTTLLWILFSTAALSALLLAIYVAGVYRSPEQAPHSRREALRRRLPRRGDLRRRLPRQLKGRDHVADASTDDATVDDGGGG